MKTKYKNLIDWISGSKELRNSDGVEVGVTSIKLTKDQNKTLNDLLDRQQQFDSGFVLCGAIKAKMYYKHDGKNIIVPLGDKDEGHYPWTKDDLRNVSFDPDFEVVDQSNPLSKIIKEGLKKIHGSPENIYHIETFFDPVVESNAEEILKYLNSSTIIAKDFEKFFKEIRLPCWLDWYFYDEDNNLLEPWDDPEFAASEENVWCNWSYKKLMKTLDLFAKGEEVFVEKIVT